MTLFITDWSDKCIVNFFAGFDCHKGADFISTWNIAMKRKVKKGVTWRIKKIM